MTDSTQELDEFMHSLGFRYQNSEGGYYIHHHVRNEKNPSSLNSVLIPYVAEQILDWHNKQIEEVKRTERLKGVRDGYNYALTDVDLATDLNNAYRRVSDGHKKAMERVND